MCNGYFPCAAGFSQLHPGGGGGGGGGGGVSEEMRPVSGDESGDIQGPEVSPLNIMLIEP